MSEGEEKTHELEDEEIYVERRKNETRAMRRRRRRDIGSSRNIIGKEVVLTHEEGREEKLKKVGIESKTQEKNVARRSWRRKTT